MLWKELTGRLEALGPQEVARGPRPGVWVASVVTYNDEQQGLFLVALE
jgi:hypothetical protein